MGALRCTGLLPTAIRKLSTHWSRPAPMQTARASMLGRRRFTWPLDGHALRQFRYSCNTVPIRTKATGLGRMHLTLRWLLVRAARRWNGSCGSTLVPVDEKEKRTDVAIACLHRSFLWLHFLAHNTLLSVL